MDDFMYYLYCLILGFFPLAPVYCLAWICLDVLFCTASIMHLCTISVDRYLSLRYPIKFGRNKTCRRVTLKIVFVWLLSIAMSLPLSLMYSKDYNSVLVDGTCQIPDPLYKLIGSIVCFYIPLCVMLITYALTVRLLAVQQQNLGGKPTGWSSGWMEVPGMDRVCTWRRLLYHSKTPMSSMESTPQHLHPPVTHHHSSSRSTDTDMTTLDTHDLWLPDSEPAPSTLSALHQFGAEMLRLSRGLESVGASLSSQGSPQTPIKSRSSYELREEEMGLRIGLDGEINRNHVTHWQTVSTPIKRKPGMKKRRATTIYESEINSSRRRGRICSLHENKLDYFRKKNGCFETPHFSDSYSDECHPVSNEFKTGKQPSPIDRLPHESRNVDAISLVNDVIKNSASQRKPQILNSTLERIKSDNLLNKVTSKYARENHAAHHKLKRVFSDSFSFTAPGKSRMEELNDIYCKNLKHNLLFVKSGSENNLDDISFNKDVFEIELRKVASSQWNVSQDSWSKKTVCLDNNLKETESSGNLSADDKTESDSQSNVLNAVRSCKYSVERDERKPGLSLRTIQNAQIPEYPGEQAMEILGSDEQGFFSDGTDYEKKDDENEFLEVPPPCNKCPYFCQPTKSKRASKGSINYRNKATEENDLRDDIGETFPEFNNQTIVKWDHKNSVFGEAKMKIIMTRNSELNMNRQTQKPTLRRAATVKNTISKEKMLLLSKLRHNPPAVMSPESPVLVKYGSTMGTASSLNVRNHHSRNSSLMARNSSRHGRIIRLEQKATKVLGVVFFTFVILWAPFFVLNLVPSICSECEKNINKGVFDLVTWLGYASSMVNPIFYTIFNKVFRQTFKKVLLCKYHRTETWKPIPKK